MHSMHSGSRILWGFIAALRNKLHCGRCWRAQLIKTPFEMNTIRSRHCTSRRSAVERSSKKLIDHSDASEVTTSQINRNNFICLLISAWRVIHSNWRIWMRLQNLKLWIGDSRMQDSKIIWKAKFEFIWIWMRDLNERIVCYARPHNRGIIITILIIFKSLSSTVCIRLAERAPRTKLLPENLLDPADRGMRCSAMFWPATVSIRERESL